MTDSAAEALAILRDPTIFKWYFIPWLALVVYAYANEIERQNWSLVFAGLAFWGMDWLNGAGKLAWEYAWWSTSAPLLIFMIGYLPFFLVSFWVYDMPTLRHNQLINCCENIHNS